MFRVITLNSEKQHLHWRTSPTIPAPRPLFPQEGFTDTWAVNSGSAKHCEGLRGFREHDTGLLRNSSSERCGGCGGYFGSSAAARVWCVYINFKRSKKTAPAAPALAGQQPFPTTTGRPRTLYPESGNRSQRRGIEESGNRIRGSGYGLRGKGTVVVVLRRRCFFSELRVITLKREKYSTLKTTTTDYLHQSLQPQQAEAAVDPQRPRSIFSSDTHLYTAHTCEKTAPHRWRLPLPR